MRSAWFWPSQSWLEEWQLHSRPSLPSMLESTAQSQVLGWRWLKIIRRTTQPPPPGTFCTVTQALFLCHFCVVFHASCAIWTFDFFLRLDKPHKISNIPRYLCRFCKFPIVSFIAFIFSEKDTITPATDKSLFSDREYS